MDRLSGGSYGKQEDEDHRKVIAERDALKKELEELGRQFNEMFEVTRQIAAAKDELITCLENLTHENAVLRTALGEQAKGLGVKN